MNLRDCPTFLRLLRKSAQALLDAMREKDPNFVGVLHYRIFVGPGLNPSSFSVTAEPKPERFEEALRADLRHNDD